MTGISVGFLQYKIEKDAYEMKLSNGVIDVSAREPFSIEEWYLLDKSKYISVDQYKRIKAIMEEE